ncbi:hypothetical protein [Longimicrobium sp.]|uniref:hypothetical protein n=1 Tax=Longimicrobium sp. TaxID=2029185 RepID=UPI002D7F6A6C|nr:hypothetical protein [Longimicrobium sp.]
MSRAVPSGAPSARSSAAGLTSSTGGAFSSRRGCGAPGCPLRARSARRASCRASASSARKTTAGTPLVGRISGATSKIGGRGSSASSAASAPVWKTGTRPATRSGSARSAVRAATSET